MIMTIAAAAVTVYLTNWSAPLMARVFGRKTIDDRLQQYGDAARLRLHPHFERAGVAYPPVHVVLLGLKQEKQLQVYAADEGAALRLVRSYPIVAASGGPGPKLREGDRQVPEGIYAIESLNPNSRFHLSLRLNYPNEHDRAMAAIDGRTNLGSDIMIHGKSSSVGCLAMGDEAAEDLFVLVAETGLSNCRVILAPYDMRDVPVQPESGAQPAWITPLYAELRMELRLLDQSSAPSYGGTEAR